MSFACLVTPCGPQHFVGTVTSSVLHTLTSITIKGSKEFPELTARSWVRRLIDGLSPRSSGFSTRLVHVGSVVDEVALWQTFCPITSVFPCQHHSTDPPYYFFFRPLPKPLYILSHKLSGSWQMVLLLHATQNSMQSSYWNGWRERKIMML